MFFHTNLKKVAIILACIGILGAASEEPVPMPPDIVPETKLESESNKPHHAQEAQKSIEVVNTTHQTSLKVLEFVLAHQVEGREPKGITETFNEHDEQGGSVYAFARLSAEKPTTVSFVWFKDGKEHYRFNTVVQVSQRWRTYSSVRLRAGNWKVQLVLPDSHEVLTERTFTVQ